MLSLYTLLSSIFFGIKDHSLGTKGRTIRKVMGGGGDKIKIRTRQINFMSAMKNIIKSLLARLFIVGKQGQALFYSGLAIRDVSHLSTKVCRLISSIDVYRRL